VVRARPPAKSAEANSTDGRANSAKSPEECVFSQNPM
jgi:hypothetical protein